MTDIFSRITGKVIEPIRVRTRYTESETISTEGLNSELHLSKKATGGSGTSGDPYQIDESVIDGRLGPIIVDGQFETSGFESDPTQDYNDDAIYFHGYGPHRSALVHEDGTSPTIKISADSTGNFSGASWLQVFGAGKGVGSASIIENNGDTIDSLWCNLYIRHGGGDGLEVGSSASGTRIRNIWAETCTGWGINATGGDRLKISDVHCPGNDAGGIRLDVSNTNVSNVTLPGGGNDGIRVEPSRYRNTLANLRIHNVGNNAVQIDGDENTVSNLVNNGADQTLRIDGDKNTATNIISITPRQRGIFLVGDSNVVNNAIIDSPRHDLPAIGIANDDNHLSDIYMMDSSNEGGDIIDFSNGNRNVVNGLFVEQTVDGNIILGDNTMENVLWGVRGVGWSQINDTGTRNLINGWGTNNGDPNTEGQWNGNVGYAGALGATIWDTSTSPWTPYEPQPDGGGWHAT